MTDAQGTLYLHKHRISLPFERVSTTPGVSDVIQMCNELRHVIPITQTTFGKMRTYLPYMLEGAPFQMKGKDVTVPQYKGGMNTYDYFRQMEKLDHEYDPDNGNGRWLRSSARFLVCWVAEELKREHSVGEGWCSVFYVGPEKNQPTTNRTRTLHCSTLPLVAEQTATVAPLFTPDMEKKFLEYQMGDEEETSMETVTTRKYRKPSKLVQSNRTLARSVELRIYLDKTRKRKGHLCKGLLRKQVKTWLTTTSDGRELLKACEVDEDAFDVDHVWAQSIGGPDVVENYHVMPCGVNSHFQDIAWNSKEKRDYVGEEQVRIVRDLAVGARDTFDWIFLTSK
jgi:hypothetical protein